MMKFSSLKESSSFPTGENRSQQQGPTHPHLPVHTCGRGPEDVAGWLGVPGVGTPNVGCPAPADTATKIRNGNTKKNITQHVLITFLCTVKSFHTHTEKILLGGIRFLFDPNKI